MYQFNKKSGLNRFGDQNQHNRDNDAKWCVECRPKLYILYFMLQMRLQKRRSATGTHFIIRVGILPFGGTGGSGCQKELPKRNLASLCSYIAFIIASTVLHLWYTKYVIVYELTCFRVVCIQCHVFRINCFYIV